MTVLESATSPGASVGGDRTLKYWGDVSADISGMLGGIPDIEGFSDINKIDLQGSRNFLAKLGIGLKNNRRRVKSVLEGGAGIGRVTEGLLLPITDEIDIIEPVTKLTAALQGKPGIRSVTNVGLAEWRPSKDVCYDLVWIQWCIGYLSDQELVDHLRLCKSALKADDGLIVVKDNISSSDEDIFDDEENSITRLDSKLQTIFKEAGLRVVRAEVQKGIPQFQTTKLLPIKMYALKPDLTS